MLNLDTSCNENSVIPDQQALCMYMHDQATPNKFLDSHTKFVKNWGRWEDLFFIFRTALKTEHC